MNKIYIFTCIVAAFMIVGFAAGPANVNGTLATTAPGEDGLFCGSSGCHVGNAFNTVTTLEIKDDDGNVINSYLPGENYKVSTIITATTGTPDGYGFQIVGLKDEDDTEVGGWSSILQSGIQAVKELDRTYHEQEGAQDNNIFTIDWTAPEAGTGNITFYAAGNAVNRNGSPGGDGADTVRMTILEDVSADVFDFAGNEIEFNVFPNPVNDKLHISIDDTERFLYNIQDLTGRLIKNGKITEGSVYLEIGNLPSGVYLLTIFTDYGQNLKTTKLIKE